MATKGRRCHVGGGVSVTVCRSKGLGLSHDVAASEKICAEIRKAFLHRNLLSCHCWHMLGEDIFCLSPARNHDELRSPVLCARTLLSRPSCDTAEVSFRTVDKS